MQKEEHQSKLTKLKELISKAKEAAGENWPAGLDSDFTNFTDYFDGLGPAFAEVNKESATRKQSLRDKDEEIRKLSTEKDELAAEISTLKSDKTDLETKVSEMESARESEQESMKDFRENRRTEFKRMAEHYKLADNETLKDEFVDLDKLDEMSPENVESNFKSLQRLQRLKVLDKPPGVPQGAGSGSGSGSGSGNGQKPGEGESTQETKLPYNN